MSRAACCHDTLATLRRLHRLLAADRCELAGSPLGHQRPADSWRQSAARPGWLRRTKNPSSGSSSAPAGSVLRCPTPRRSCRMASRRSSPSRVSSSCSPTITIPMGMSACGYLLHLVCRRRSSKRILLSITVRRMSVVADGSESIFLVSTTMPSLGTFARPIG